MKLIKARIVDATHLELTQPISSVPGEYVQIAVPDGDDEDQPWRQAAHRHFLSAYAEEDAAYDDL